MRCISTRMHSGVPPSIVELAGADQGHVAQADGRAAVAGNIDVDVVGGREEDADDVVLADAVALEHAVHQRLHALGDLLDGVGVDRGRAAQRERHRARQATLATPGPAADSKCAPRPA